MSFSNINDNKNRSSVTLPSKWPIIIYSNKKTPLGRLTQHMAEPEGVQQLGWWRVTLPYLYSSPFGTLSTFLREADTNEWNITLNTTLAIHFPHRNHGARHDIRLTCLCVIKSFLSIFYLQSFGLLKKSTTTSFSNINSNALNIRKYPPAKPLH